MTHPATVLNVNKFFYGRAGAETVFFGTRDLLIERGHTVVDFAMEDDKNEESRFGSHFAPRRAYLPGEASKRERVTAAASSIYSPSARSALRRLLSDRTTPRPDVAHLHNVYYQLTPSIIDELERQSIPIVMTIHDWKIACPAYTLFRDGVPCRSCVGTSFGPAVSHSCIKGSRAASALGALESLIAKRRHSYEKVQRFIAPSAFAAEVLGLAGIPETRISILPNFLPDSAFHASPPEKLDPPTVLYAGRLEETKGVHDLLAAWEVADPPGRLVIAGSGPLEPQVRSFAERRPEVEFRGFLPPSGVRTALAEATVSVLPARWEENCPMIVLESHASHTPVIGTTLGGLPSLISDGVDGFLVPPGDAAGLADRLAAVVRAPEMARSMGAAAASRAELMYSSATHYEALTDIYQLAGDTQLHRGTTH